MISDPILDEIHATREKLLAEHCGDLHAYVESARKRALDLDQAKLDRGHLRFL
jgi:energy-converting hydrogenase A subunit M